MFVVFVAALFAPNLPPMCLHHFIRVTVTLVNVSSSSRGKK